MKDYASVSGTFATVTGLGAYLTEQFNAGSLDLVNGTGAAVALQLSQVTGPPTATTGQPITVNWQVSNSGSNNADGSWQDSVYLSTTPTITAASGLLGSVMRSGGLPAGGLYNASWTGPLPAIPPGSYYILVQVDSLNQVPNTNRANDIGVASAGPMEVTLPSLTLGTPYQDSFTAADQDRSYQLTVSQSATLTVTLASAAASGETALYVGEAYLPTPYAYDFASTLPQANQSVTVPLTEAGTYYVLAHSVAGQASDTGFQITALFPGFTLQSASPNVGGNTGNVTLSLHGSDLAADMTPSLVLGATTLQASSTVVTDATLLLATFNLTGATPGVYAVQLTDPSSSQTASLPAAFTVEAGRGGKLSVSLGMPAEIRAGRPGTVVISYANKGDNDITLPLITVVDPQGGLLQYLADSAGDVGQMTFLAPPVLPGLAELPPGASGTVQLLFTPAVTQGNAQLEVYADTFDDPTFAATPIDWAAASQALQPAGVSNQSWNAYVTAYEALYGNTYGAFFQFVTSQIQSMDDPDVAQEIFVDGTWLFDYRPQDVFDQSAVNPFDPAPGKGLFYTPVNVNPPTPAPSSPNPVNLPQLPSSSAVGNDYVLVIADDFKNTGADLPGVDSDVEAIKNTFKDLMKNQVQIVQSTPGNPLTAQDASQAIQNALNGKGPNDRVFIFIDSHGTNGVLSNPAGFDYPSGVPGVLLDNNTILTGSAINQAIQGANGGQGATCPTLLVDDTCHSADVTAQITQMTAPNVVPISSAGGNEIAAEWGSYINQFLQDLQASPSGNVMDSFMQAAQQITEDHPNQHPGVPQVTGPPGSTMLPQTDLKPPIVKQMGNKLATGTPAAKGLSPVVASHDPNALIGPTGLGAQKLIQPPGTFAYTVEFENDGSAAAQNVTVTEQLASNLNWSTFQLSSFGFGPVNVTIPAGLTEYQTAVIYQNTDGSALDVEVALDFDVQTGILTVTFTSLDPTTGQAPAGVLDGFLPPDNSSHIGEGFVTYTVSADAQAASGTAVNAQASVVFDTNGALATDIASNTVANVLPQTNLSELAGTTKPTVEKISTLLTGNYSDPDKNNKPGIAVIYTSGTGTWQYSAIGKTWTNIGAVATTGALLLPQTDQVRFLPTGPAAGSAELLYVAWDGSTGKAGQYVNASTTGGGASFSANAGELDVTLSAVTQAPVWLPGSTTLTPVLPGGSNTGETVADAFDSVFSGDDNQSAGIAVVGLAGTTEGTWKYAIYDSNTQTYGSFQSFSKVSSKSALLLGPNDMIEFVPNKDTFTGLVTLTVQAWDGAGGVNDGGTVNLSKKGNTGGKTPFSSTSLTGNLHFNDAPTQNPPANPIPFLPSAIAENAPSKSVSVATLLKDAHASDPDKDALGLALTAVSGNGVWQYELPHGMWENVPSTVSDASVLLLPGTALLRFDPTPDYSGQAVLSWLAWDETQGKAGQQGFDLSGSGGATAFSSTSASAALTVTASQHPTAWSGKGATLTPVQPTDSNPPGNTVASVFGNHFDDQGKTVGIAISGVGGTSLGQWEYTLAGGSMWQNLPAISTKKALLLSANDLIRFLPNGNGLGTATLTAYAWDGSTGTDGATAHVKGSAFSTTTLTATCLVNNAATLND